MDSANRRDLGRELGRKLFHMLTLVYLWLFWRFGSPIAVWIIGAWLAVEGALEFARLKLPEFNRRLIGAFGFIHRSEEEDRISGIFWTGLGCWLTIVMFSRHSPVVFAAILYLALGDAAAALAGKAVGRRLLPFATTKTWEGSVGCLAVCVAVGWLLGLGAAKLWIGALTATFFESASIPPNDNIWLPLGSGLVLWVCGFF